MSPTSIGARDSSRGSSIQLNSVSGSAITGPALWAAAKLRVHRWNKLASAPGALQRAQEETLTSLIRKAEQTEFGRKHGYARIRSHQQFVQQVPIRTYADFEADLMRMRNGATDVLWPGLIPYFGQSSGSSNTAAAHKFLPISNEQIRWQQKAGFDIIARYLDLTNDLSLTGGYILGLLPPGIIKREGSIGVASNPGIMQLHVPPVARRLQLPRPDIRDTEDYDRKLSMVAESYLDYDVRALTGTTCWFSILFDRVIAAARARGRKVDCVRQIWPNLRALFGGGVHAEPYRKIVQERIGRRVVLIDNYNATEGGLFAATDRLDEPGMLMIPDRGVFFEFVARDELGKDSARRVPLWKVEPNVDYAVVLTTSSGLAAYDIGDYVRFSSVFPHRMEFAGRAAGVLSVTQELTTALELERAVTEASRQQPVSLVDFAASSEVGVDGSSRGRYVFFVEFNRPPEDLGAFSGAVDQALCRQNRVYREHRNKDVAILPPVVVSLKQGATQSFMQSLGLNSVQNKFPRIIDDSRSELLRSFAQPNPQ